MNITSHFNMNNQFLRYNILFYILLFIGFFIFYAEVHPIIPFDADDWESLNFHRQAYPSLDYWNPTKVFPECFQPLVGLIAAYLVYPITGDYLNALLYSHAFAVSSFIILYLYSLQKLLKSNFPISNLTSYAIIIVYVLFHFLILRVFRSNNDYLLFSLDANCYYHYTIPNLLCASLVMWLMRNDVTKLTGGLKISMLVLATYLALCSNLFSTVILIAYIGANLLLSLFKQEKSEKGWLWAYVKKNTIFLSIITFWLIIQLIEANGYRAAYSNMESPFMSGIIETCKNFVRLHFNLRFTAIAILSVGAAFGYAVFKNREDWKQNREKLGILTLALVLVIAYLILLCSRVDPVYMMKGQVVFAYTFFILLIVILSIAYLCVKFTPVKVAMPLLAILIFFEINTRGKTFLDVQYEFIDNPQACMELNRVLIDKIQKADQAHQDSIVIMVPNFGNWDNWPLSYNCSNVGIALYKHNIINRPIRTIYKPFGVVHQTSDPFYTN